MIAINSDSKNFAKKKNNANLQQSFICRLLIISCALRAHKPVAISSRRGDGSTPAAAAAADDAAADVTAATPESETVRGCVD